MQYFIILLIWFALVLSLRDVKSAILEQNGQLILTKAGEENPKYPLITDGVIQHNILEVIDKTEEWVTEQLAVQDIQDPSEVFLAEYNNGQLTVVKY